MKNILLILFAIFSISISAQNQFYYYNGQKLLLEPINDFLFVSMKHTLSQTEALKQQTVIEDCKKTDLLSMHQGRKSIKSNPHFFRLKLDSDTKQKEYSETIKQLYKNEDIDYITPYYKTLQGDTVTISNMLHVKLNNVADTVLLKKYCSENNLLVIKQDNFMPQWFLLSVCTDATKNALELANQLYENGIVKYAEPDFIGGIGISSINVTDPHWGSQWGLNNTGQYVGNSGIDIKAREAWAISNGQNVRVAVFDQGIQLNHPDLQNNINATSYDAISGNQSIIYGSHGTACAGIIGATANTIGIRGVASSSELISVSYPFGIDVSNAVSFISNGINWAVNHGADVISNSWSMGISSQLITDAINNAVTNGRNGLGCVVVFSAGNDNSNVNFPASLPQVLSVGAISQCGERKSPTSCDGENWWGTNYGSALDVVAPGVKIYTTDLIGNSGYNAGDYFDSFNGTSAACPHVAGVAALMLSVNPNLTGSRVQTLIESTARKVGNYSYTGTSGRTSGTWNNEMGYGLVDARAAVLAALDLSLSGTDIICPLDGPRTYSISNLPANAAVSWRCTGNASIDGSASGRSCSIRGIKGGYCNLFATIDINGTTTELQKLIEVSSSEGDLAQKPYVTYSIDRDYLQLMIHTPNLYGIREFIWNAQPIGSGGSSQSSHTGPGGYYWTIPKGSYNIEVRIVTQCGHFLTTATVGGYSAKIYPNPVEQTLFVDIDNPIENIPTILSASTRKAAEYDIRLFNIQGALVRQLQSPGGKISLDVSSLPNGNYFLHIYEKNTSEPQVHKIIINH